MKCFYFDTPFTEKREEKNNRNKIRYEMYTNNEYIKCVKYLLMQANTTNQAHLCM